MAVLLALGTALGFLEARLPLFNAIPGGKIGLANITAVAALYLFGPVCALVLSLLRAVLVSLLTGAVTMLFYSAAGSVLCVLGMQLSRRFAGGALSAVGVSIIGALCFNLGQTAVAALVVANINMLRYLPVLCFISAFSGAAVGLAAGMVIKRFGENSHV